MIKSPRLFSSSSIYVKVGGWFEASATGWGVVVVPVVLLLLLAASVVRPLTS